MSLVLEKKNMHIMFWDWVLAAADEFYLFDFG